MAKIPFGKVVGRFLGPWHLWQVIKLQRNRKRKPRVYDDAQLKLYGKILPGDFLHYGYFENPDISPDEISVKDIYRAQLQYAKELANLCTDTSKPILDIGCGMGGLLPVLETAGFKPEALTPDATQIQNIQKKYSHVPLHPCRFEDFEVEGKMHRYGTLVTSESLQYLNLEVSLPMFNQLLAPGGKWVACDYFRTGNDAEKSGHQWEPFKKALDEHGWKITYDRDITPNILPTIGFVHFWATQIGMPLKEFGIEKLQVKAPGIYYALSPIFPAIEASLQKNIATVDPALFGANKRYRLLVMERIN
jgi:cyclopropane fatty-acyl-phospholipid synthase-like methyltransferase